MLNLKNTIDNKRCIKLVCSKKRYINFIIYWLYICNINYYHTYIGSAINFNYPKNITLQWQKSYESDKMYDLSQNKTCPRFFKISDVVEK